MIDFDGMDASDDETQEENERVLAFFDQLVDHGTDMSSSDEGIHVCVLLCSQLTLCYTVTIC